MSYSVQLVTIPTMKHVLVAVSEHLIKCQDLKLKFWSWQVSSKTSMDFNQFLFTSHCYCNQWFPKSCAVWPGISCNDQHDRHQKVTNKHPVAVFRTLWIHSNQIHGVKYKYLWHFDVNASTGSSHFEIKWKDFKTLGSFLNFKLGDLRLFLTGTCYSIEETHWWQVLHWWILPITASLS